MALVSKLQRILGKRSGRVIVGGTALGLGSVGAAVAQEGVLADPTRDGPVDSDSDPNVESGTTVDLEGENVLVPAAEQDALLEDSLDDEGEAAVVETPDTPASPDTPPSPHDQESPPSPATADEQSPPSPATADEQSPPSPATADEQSPPSPATVEQETPPSPETADAQSPPSPDSAAEREESPDSPESP